MINLNHKPSTTHKLVFGEQDIGRLDLSYDTKFKQLAEMDEANVWFLNVVSCSNDRWYEYPESALTKFRLTIAYQTVLDSLVPDVFKYLSEVVTDPWLKYLYSRISTMEHVHALSYSSGVTQAFGAKATEFLDVIYSDPHIKHRIDDELSIAKQFIAAVPTWSNTETNRKLLLQLLVSIFALEGIKFPFSFFTSWSLNKAYNNCSQGFSTLLLSIATDEMTCHVPTGSNFLNKLRADPSFSEEFSSGWFDTMATTYLQRVCDKEIEWATYLISSGEEPGFNLPICVHFIQYWTDRRLSEIRLPTKYNVTKNDIEMWFDDYRNVREKQSALQEVSNINYQLGQCLNDLHKFDTKDTQ
jgi:ribonucleoside-diphosphate reductase beta chain